MITREYVCVSVRETKKWRERQRNGERERELRESEETDRE